MNKIAVIIPCYNEGKTIAKVVADIKTALPEAVVYVFDNNSNDNTVEQAKKAGAIIRYEHQQGKGNVIRKMFREVDAECYLMIDGDDTYPTESARVLCNRILESGADMAIGDRLSSTYFSENKRMFHNSGNVLVRKLVNTAFKGHISDIMTGYRAFSFDFVKSFPVLSHGFEIETEMSIFALDRNFNLMSIPVNYRDRPAGSISKLNTFSDGLKVIKTIFHLIRDYKPMLFFSLLFIILTFLSIMLFLPVFIEYLETGLVLRFPTLITSGFIMVSALLSLACGMILDSVVKHSRSSFEIHRNEITILHNMIKNGSKSDAFKELQGQRVD